MELFMLRCEDVPNSAPLRAAHREAHLAYVRGSGRTRLAGPLLCAQGAVNGSFLFIEAADLDDALAFAAADPFRQAGVYQDVEIRPCRLTYIMPDAGRF